MQAPNMSLGMVHQQSGEPCLNATQNPTASPQRRSHPISSRRGRAPSLNRRHTAPAQTPRSSSNHDLRGQDSAPISAAASRYNARRAEDRRPSVPRRTSSVTRPSKRKRHEDMAAFHRNSCQLFSSLDGTLAQMRASTSSSSSSSSSCTAPSDSDSPRPSTSPHSSGPSTRATSFEDDPPNQLGDRDGCQKQTRATQEMKSAVPRRPVLQRGQHFVSPPPSSPPPSLPASYRDTHRGSLLDRSISPTETEEPLTEVGSLPGQCEPRSRPSITTHSCYSSKVTLPLQHHQGEQPGSPTGTDPTITTTIHWTSPKTRRREYAKIDAAHSGVRLCLRKIFPRAMCRRVGGGRMAFWDERATNEGGEADAGSVRRFRLDFEDGHGDGARDDIMTDEEATHDDLDRRRFWHEKTAIVVESQIEDSTDYEMTVNRPSTAWIHGSRPFSWYLRERRPLTSETTLEPSTSIWDRMRTRVMGRRSHQM